MKKAFTLIELLVVVLIIGTLAAVALPQYNKAVEKSRAAEALQVIRRIADAEEMYYLLETAYTNDFNFLGIDEPVMKYFRIMMGANTPATANIILFPKNNKPYYFRYFMKNITWAKGFYDGRLLCVHDEGNKEGEEMCGALGGKDKHAYQGMANTTAYFIY